MTRQSGINPFVLPGRPYSIIVLPAFMVLLIAVFLLIIIIIVVIIITLPIFIYSKSDFYGIKNKL